MENTLEKTIEQSVYFGNSIQAYLIFLVVLVVSYFGLLLVRKFTVEFLKEWVKKTETQIDDVLLEILSEIKKPFFFAISFYHALSYITIPAPFLKIIKFIVLAVVMISILQALTRVLTFALGILVFGDKSTDPVRKNALKNVEALLKFGLWTAGFLFYLDNLGINVTSVLAGLGIGGIAVALAAQNILGDTFSSFTIFLDRPFEVGDAIEVGGLNGVVENIGLKTTRVRSVSGELLVFGNSDLTSSRIRNFQKMSNRRVVFKIGVVYQTPKEKLQMIPAMIQSAISALPNVSFDRAHLQTFGDSALVFESVYFVNNSDYKLFMDIQQSINFKIIEEFSFAGIEFAYPTHTVFYQNKG
jgi:small-conductance mechanosensitive channel